MLAAVAGRQFFRSSRGCDKKFLRAGYISFIIKDYFRFVRLISSTKMAQIIECVPNFSEGRDQQVIALWRTYNAPFDWLIYLFAQSSCWFFSTVFQSIDWLIDWEIEIVFWVLGYWRDQ